jgi:ABC-2 type transport system ATP-binding protein
MAPIEIRNLSKAFGPVQAVRDLSFEVEAGRVTGFLGPNGAGKSTTLRMLLGLIRPSAGTATFDGQNYEQLPDPSHHVGALLEETSFHPSRTGRNHLRVLAAAGGHDRDRVDKMIDLVGLRGAENRRVKGYSMGMRQRLAIASALLGDPKVLILDEPTNGLDPNGIRWLRELLRQMAAEGRAVLVSSHLLAEVAQSVDDVVVISHGGARAIGSLENVLGDAQGEPVTEVRSPYRDHLASALEKRGHKAQPTEAEWLLVPGATPEQVGIAAAEDGITLYGLGARKRSLEDTFFALTGEQADMSDSGTHAMPPVDQAAAADFPPPQGPPQGGPQQ